MKNILTLIIAASLAVACSKSPKTPEPDPVQVDKPQIGQKQDFPVTETKEPYAEFTDEGFEAILILLDIDSDNQINGKVALQDLQRVTHLRNSLPSSYWDKRAFIESTYGEIPKTISFDNIKLLSNLKVLEIYGGEHLNLSNNLELEEIRLLVPAIKTINLRNLKKLKKIHFYPQPGIGYVPLPNIQNFKEIDLSDNISLEVLKYYGNASQLDLSKNINLRELFLHLASYQDKVLDLTHNKSLEILDCTELYSLTEVFVSKETLSKINGSPDNWKKPENAVWKVKE